MTTNRMNGEWVSRYKDSSIAVGYPNGFMPLTAKQVSRNTKFHFFRNLPTVYMNEISILSIQNKLGIDRNGGYLIDQYAFQEAYSMVLISILYN